ncbi:hypothetical protein CSAL01_12724 [Colletotrichum salicis]|uniref:Uncharacterized protein n=1 Tax=Colletotrichum salicis TaxID=1209931 RepID=A0A135UKE8_9PEZI|nr:hypothetical protein CSAL01_12724 [Colletotrichum salicis]
MSASPLTMMVFGDRRRLTARPETYNHLMTVAWNAFGSKAVNLTFHCTSKSGEQEFELDRSVYRAVEDGWVLRLEPRAGPLIKPKDEPKETPKRKRVSWHVSVKPDGTLKDTATDIDCNCLVWEAEAWIERSSAVTEAHFFNPRNPLAYFADNYILSFDNFVPFLYRALASLTSTSAMRTVMIAFNFIPQTDFEKAGKLTVTPGPSSVARFFLVFRGVVGSKNAENHAELDALDWPSKIGIDVEGMMNQSKFCVMEWGGMEVNMG